MLLFELTARIYGYYERQTDQWKHTRLILAALSGNDPRHIIPLPGDWDHLDELPSTEDLKRRVNADEIFKRLEHG